MFYLIKNSYLSGIINKSTLSEKPLVEISLVQKVTFFPKHVTFPFDNKGKSPSINGERRQLLAEDYDVIQ